MRDSGYGSCCVKYRRDSDISLRAVTSLKSDNSWQEDPSTTLHDPALMDSLESRRRKHASKGGLQVLVQFIPVHSVFLATLHSR
jgi:hypothetical protein